LSGVQTFTGAKGTFVTEFKGVAHHISQPHQYALGEFRIVSARTTTPGSRARAGSRSSSTPRRTA
jgi:hypothetical protein